MKTSGFALLFLSSLLLAAQAQAVPTAAFPLLEEPKAPAPALDIPAFNTNILETQSGPEMEVRYPSQAFEDVVGRLRACGKDCEPAYEAWLHRKHHEGLALHPAVAVWITALMFGADPVHRAKMNFLYASVYQKQLRAKAFRPEYALSFIMGNTNNWGSTMVLCDQPTPPAWPVYRCPRALEAEQKISQLFEDFSSEFGL